MFNGYTTGFCPAGINIRNVFKILTVKLKSAMYFLGRKPGGGTPHMKGVGMLVENFELNP